MSKFGVVVSEIYNSYIVGASHYCTRTSEWAVKLVCNGTGATEPVECSYMKTIGTSYTAETSDHMSISEEVSYEITVESWNFSLQLSYRAGRPVIR